MFNTTAEFKTAITQPSREIKSRVSFPATLARLLQPFSLEKTETEGDYPYVLDDQYVSSITLEDGLVFDKDFEIGTAPMGKVEIEIIWDYGEEPTYKFEGTECKIELGLELPNEIVEYVPIGEFTVESAIIKNNTLTIKAVDRMHKAEKEYESDILYPATLLDILQSACDQIGIELTTASFANNDYVVPNEPVFEGVTCRKVFAHIAELAGGYAVINREGKLEIRTLGNTITRAITKDHYIEFSKDKVANSRIETVLVRVGSEQAAAGPGQNPYSIVDNMFVQNPHLVVDAIYGVLGGLEYVSGTFTWQGDFSLDLGDMVTVDGQTMYMLDRSLRYTGGLRETTKAPAVSNVVKESTGKGSLTLEIENHKSQIRVLRDEITQTVERIDNFVVGANNRLLQSNTNIELDSDNDITVQRFLNSQTPYYRATSNQPINLYGAFPNSQFAEPLGDLGESTVSIDVLTETDSIVILDDKEYEIQGNRWTRIHVTKMFWENTTKRIRNINPYSRKNVRPKMDGTRLIDSLTANVSTLYYRNLKIERGNVPTDWNLTPEELESDVNRLNSEFKQLADSISLIARRNEQTGRFEVTPEAIVSAINTTDGVGRVYTVNFKVDEHGATIENGALIVRDSQNTAIITSDGLKVMFVYTSSGELNGWQKIGYWNDGGFATQKEAYITFIVPEKLNVTDVELVVHSLPSRWVGWSAIEGVPDGIYHPRNMRLFKVSDNSNSVLDWPAESSFGVRMGVSGRTDITDTVWGGQWTPTGDPIQEKKGDIAEFVETGRYQTFGVASVDNLASANQRYMGGMQFTVVVEGYLRG